MRYFIDRLIKIEGTYILDKTFSVLSKTHLYYKINKLRTSYAHISNEVYDSPTRNTYIWFYISKGEKIIYTVRDSSDKRIVNISHKYTTKPYKEAVSWDLYTIILKTLDPKLDWEDVILYCNDNKYLKPSIILTTDGTKLHVSNTFLKVSDIKQWVRSKKINKLLELT